MKCKHGIARPLWCPVCSVIRREPPSSTCAIPSSTGDSQVIATRRHGVTSRCLRKPNIHDVSEGEGESGRFNRQYLLSDTTAWLRVTVARYIAQKGTDR
jgi:hypothetical protein